MRRQTVMEWIIASITQILPPLNFLLGQILIWTMKQFQRIFYYLHLIIKLWDGNFALHSGDKTEHALSINLRLFLDLPPLWYRSMFLCFSLCYPCYLPVHTHGIVAFCILVLTTYLQVNLKIKTVPFTAIGYFLCLLWGKETTRKTKT
jgi:hypothetical protein